jgi:hypothetical protein
MIIKECITLTLAALFVVLISGAIEKPVPALHAQNMTKCVNVPTANMMFRLTCPGINATSTNNVTHHIQNAPNGTILLQ